MKTNRFVIVAAFAILASACAAQGGAEDGEGPSATASGAESATPTVDFTADWKVVVSSTPHQGGSLDLAYDVARLSSCAAEEGGRPVWGLTAWWSLAGAPAQSAEIAGLNASAAPFAIPLPASGDLAIWFEATNKYGCHAYDSAYGANYHVQIAPPANAPGWVGNAASVISRDETCGPLDPCDSLRAPLDGFVYDTWARERAVFAAAYFEVWKQGVTDWNDPDTWKLLDVEAHWRPVGTAAWTTTYATLDTHVGNNARYELPFASLDLLGGRARSQKSDCPVGTLTKSADGQYVQLEVELYFTVNGVELRPAPGATYHGTFSDYAGLYAVCE